MATLDQLRSLFPDAESDSDVIRSAAKEFGIDPSEIASEVGVKISAPGLWTSVKRGAGQVESALGSTIRDLGADRAGRALESYGEDVAFRNPAAVNTVSEAIRSPWQTTKEALGEVGPQVAGSTAMGVAGGALGRTIGSVVGAPAGPGGVVAGNVVGGYLGFKAGQFVSNLAQEYGGIRTEQREAGINDKGRALATATAAAALDTGFGVEGVIGKVAKGSLNILSREAGSSLTKNVLKQGAIGLGTESLTEGGQTALERLGAYKPLTGDDATNEYGMAMIKGGLGGGAIRGGMSLFAGERKSDTANEISQTMGSSDILQPDVTTTDFQPRALSENLMAGMVGGGANPLAGRSTMLGGEAPAAPAMREHITEDGEIIQVPVGHQPPAVAGGSTEIAQAQQQAQQQAAQQQAQAQQAQAAQQAAQQFGVVNPDNPSVGSAFGQKIYGPNIPAVANAIANFTVNMQPQQIALAQAITKANEQTGGQLIKYKFNATDVAASVQKGFQAVEKVANQLQIAHVQSVDEAAQILNDQSEQVKGDKLDQLNAIFQALTGKNTNGYEAAQLAQLAKGAKDGKLQLQQQTATGVGTVPVQGSTGETSDGRTGLLRPTEVQPVGATSVGAGPSDQQAGQLPASGVRPSASPSADIGVSQPIGPGQGQGQVNATETPAAASTQGAQPQGTAVGESRADESRAATAPTTSAKDEINAAALWEDMDISGVQYSQLSPALKDAWNRAVELNIASMAIQADIAREAVADSPAAEVQNIIRQVLDIVIQKEAAGSDEAVIAHRAYVAAHFDKKNADRIETLKEIAAKAGVSESMVKRWNMELQGPVFMEKYGAKMAAALELVAERMGMSTADIYSKFVAATKADTTAEVSLEEAGQSTSANEDMLTAEEAGTENEDDYALESGQEVSGTAAERTADSYESEVDQRDETVGESARLNQSVQERYNAVETNQARIIKLMEYTQAIEDAATTPKTVERAKVLKIQNKLDLANGDLAKLTSGEVFTLGIDAQSRGKFDMADEYVAELNRRIEEQYAKAKDQAKKQTAKSADIKPKKEPKNAVQKRSTKKVPVQERAGDSEALGEGNAEGGQAAAEGETKATPKQEVTVLTPAEKWEAIAADYPLVPAYSELTKDQRIRWDDLAARTEVDVTDIARIVGVAKAASTNAPAQQPKTVQQSLRRRNKGKKYTPEQLKSSLLDFMNRASLGKEVAIVDDIVDLQDLPEFASMSEAEFNKFLSKEEIDADTQAFVYKGKAYMLAGNIAVGTGRGVFMHEVGGHLGIQKALSPEMVSRLYDQVAKWAKRDDGSIESDLAAHALGRMLDSNAASPAQRQQETIAYFLEAAVNAGINPTAYNKIGSASLREWMRTLWAAFKNALRMVRGVNIDKLTGQDLVDLAYGYAQLSATRFHGSNAKFQRFLTKFMNSGAGGQQYGWGTYFAEARPTAEGYAVPDTNAPAGTRSHVYTVDLAITPDEMILWGKPMEEQSALVQALAAKYPVSGLYRGADFYKGTAERLYQEKYGAEPTNKAQRSEAEKMASQFLDAQGIKGIQYLDATTATRDTSNFVVFNEDNIIRVQTETGLAKDRQAMVPDFQWERTQQSRAAKPAGMFAKAGEWLDQAITSPKETLHKLKLGFLTLDQLAELDKSPNQAVRAYADVMTAMQKMSKDMVYKAAQIDQLWAKLDPKESERLSDVMRSATRAQFDPAITRTATNQEQQDILDGYNALTNSGRDVYGKVKKYYEEAFQTRLAIMEETAAKLGGKELQDIRDTYAKLKGPYFPLGRTGDYYAVGMSPRVAELAAKKEAEGLTNAETIELKALRQQKDQYQTSTFNTLREAKQAAERFKADMGSGYYNEVDIEKRLSSTTTKLPNFAKMEEYITSQLGGETHAEVKSMLNQMMFDMLPEHHALKNQMQREGIYGENEDMRQVFASTSISQSHYISRLKFGHELNLAMMNIGKLARRDIEMQQIKNELALRTKVSMDNTHSALFDSLVNASYFAHLGLSPAFLLTNMTQVPMITAPWLGARHGAGATKRAMAAALADTANIIKTSFTGGDWRSEINWNSLFPAGSNEDRMFRELLDRNVLDITMEHDLAAVASAQKGIFDDKISKVTGGKMGGLSDVVKLVNTPVRVTELANRAVTALSAYRLKMEALASAQTTAEERHTAAVNYAARAVSETQLNYSELNAPRHMRQVFGSKPLAKMIFQFRKFQQGMLYLVAKNIADSLPGSKASAEDRRIARRTIAGLYLTTGLMAGTTGMPLMGTVGLAGIANLIAAAFGDKDEPWDFETEYRNFLADWLGHDMALLVAKGLPAYLGADISQRVGMGDIANPIPFVQRGATGQSTLANIAYATLGAPAGMAGTMYDGVVAVANGDVLKGMEKIIPIKAVKDALRTYRYSDEGMTDKRGNVILAPEKFDTWDLALRGMGFTPTKEAEYYEANAALQAAKTAATDVRTRLLREYSEAKLKGESTETVDAKIAEFNDRHPEKGVKIDFSTKLKSVQARRKMAAERTESGVRVGKYEKPFASEARFAEEQ